MPALVFSALIAALATQPGGPEAFRAEAGAARGPHFVGEAIGIAVRVSSADGRPPIVPPFVRGATLRPVGTDVQPISTSAIGDAVREFNRYIYRYELTVEGAGTYTLPPFRLRQGGRSTSTAPLRITVRPIPSNRPKSFLGGVGPISVETDAVPASITLGERLEYRVTVTGPGALGFRQPPTLERVRRLPIAPEVRMLSDERVESPPKRLFRYELRPTKGGEVTVPPLVLSTFDPRTQQFQTALSHSVPIRVVEPGPNQVESELPDLSTRKSGSGRVGIGQMMAIVAVLAIVPAGLWWTIRRRRSARFRPGRWARERSEHFGGRDTADLPREVTESLAEFLHLSHARPAGALTPMEAHAGIIEAGGSPALADEAARLVELCDARWFDRRRTDGSGDALGGRASRFFGELGREMAAARKHRERHSRPPR